MIHIVIFPALAITFLFFIIKYSRRVWDIKDTPTVSPSGAIIGLCEVIGTASPGELPSGTEVVPGPSPIMGKDCVWYRVSAQYFVEGKNGGWENLFSTESQGGFRLRDEYGSINVVPSNIDGEFIWTVKNSESNEVKNRAKYFYNMSGFGESRDGSADWAVSADGYYWWHPAVGHWIPYTCVSPDRAQYFDYDLYKWRKLDMQNSVSILGFDITDIFFPDPWKQRVRVSEEIVSLDTKIFAHGIVNISADGTDLVLGKYPSDISRTTLTIDSEDGLISKIQRRKLALTLGAVLTSLISFFLFLFLYNQASNNRTGGGIDRADLLFFTLYYCLVILASVLIIRFFRIYNRYVRLKQQIELSRSAIDVTQRRRSTLIPELVDVLEEASKHEKSVQSSLARLRSLPEDMASKEIKIFLENYPLVKLSTNFLHMQKELGRTEEKIAMARSFVNDSILAMDNLRTTLTGMILSPFFAKEERPSV